MRWVGGFVVKISPAHEIFCSFVGANVYKDNSQQYKNCIYWQNRELERICDIRIVNENKRQDGRNDYAESKG